ncbi:MAG: hypothetical protein AB1898_21005 [Acidobacteriota bacterium]
MDSTREIPQRHPVRQMFHTLTERALEQSHLSDQEIHCYLSNLLVEFLYVENLYKVKDETGRRLEYVIDMLSRAEDAGSAEKKEVYKHVGDFSLFILGLFPESLHRRRINANYYAAQGRRSYRIRWEMENYRSAVVIFRKLSEQFEGCVYSLNWVKSYINDPFYQYMFREFEIT